MAFLYAQPAGNLHFLQKRYTRIFPLFLSMCLVMFIYHLAPKCPILLLLGVVVLVASLVHLLWVYVLKRLARNAKTYLFFFFLVMQLAVGGVYVFWIMRHPAVAFTEQLPTLFREGMIFLVNATLTLPLGDYIPMLDGVYWSLVAEVLFYVLYPILVVPLVIFLQTKSRNVKIFSLFAVTLLIGGIAILSHKVLVMSLIQPALWEYFVVGIILAYIYKHKPHVITHLAHLANRVSWLQVILFISILFAEHRVEYLLPSSAGGWIRIVFAVPLVILVALLLDQTTCLSRIFRSKWLVFLGTISYSIYLSHALIIHLAERLFIPTDFLTNAAYIVLTFLVDVGVASLLFWLLERPYFLRKTGEQKTAQAIPTKRYYPKLILSFISISYLLTLFFAYSSHFNFFSVVFPIAPQNITPITSGSSISLRSYPSLQVRFTGKSNDLGLLAVKVKHDSQKMKGTSQTLLFSLQQEGNAKAIVATPYNLDYFNSGDVFPFGFPAVHDSKGKTFLATFTLSNKTGSDFVIFDKTSFETVYPADKKLLLTHPSLLITFIQEKFVSILANSAAFLPLLLGVPFFLLVFYLFINRRKRNT